MSLATTNITHGRIGRALAWRCCSVAGARITLTSPVTLVHAVGAQVSGSGITLSAPLARAHANASQVTSEVPTPGAPNQYYGKRN